jgi:hypothetical protein
MKNIPDENFEKKRKKERKKERNSMAALPYIGPTSSWLRQT